MSLTRADSNIRSTPLIKPVVVMAGSIQGPSGLAFVVQSIDVTGWLRGRGIVTVAPEVTTYPVCWVSDCIIILVEKEKARVLMVQAQLVKCLILVAPLAYAIFIVMRCP